MAEVLDFSGDNDFSPGRFLYQKHREPSLFSSLGSHVDAYIPLRKRARISSPFSVRELPRFQPSIEVLPDECLFEVFRRLEGGQERSSCALVSKRWLMILSGIGRDEICTPVSEPEIKPDTVKLGKPTGPEDKGKTVNLNGLDEEFHEPDPHGFLSRCLEGKKATDVRLAAISVGTASRGGLGKLSIRGNNSTRRLTDLGLKAVSRGCPSLKALSLWSLSSVGDEGLSEIATSCCFLEKLDLSHCPAITDKGLIAIAMNCPNLASVTLESCPNIGNESLNALGKNCSNLKSITLKNCPLVGDNGITGLFTLAGQVLAKANFQTLDITEASLAVIGHYGSELTYLALGDLRNVKERGFWVMGKSQGLQKLKSLSINSCQGVSDIVLGAIGRGCPDLKMFVLKKCPLVSDNGVVAFAKAGGSLESLKLEEIPRVTQFGVFGVLANCDGKKLKALALVNCLGIKDGVFRFALTSLCYSLRFFTISNCPGLGDFGLGVLGGLCPNLTHVDFKGLHGITDAGVLSLLKNSKGGVTKVTLSGCVKLSDCVVCEIAKVHGETLEVLNLDGCKNISDASLVAVAKNCTVLCELDVSGSETTDYGIRVLAGAKQLSLRIVSLAGCSLVTEKSLHFLGIMGKALLGLNIQNCSRISSGAVNLLIERLWRCDILS